jgi:hypothetical protein
VRTILSIALRALHWQHWATAAAMMKTVATILLIVLTIACIVLSVRLWRGPWRTSALFADPLFYLYLALTAAALTLAKYVGSQ